MGERIVFSILKKSCYFFLVIRLETTAAIPAVSDCAAGAGGRERGGGVLVHN